MTTTETTFVTSSAVTWRSPCWQLGNAGNRPAQAAGGSDASARDTEAYLHPPSLGSTVVDATMLLVARQKLKPTGPSRVSTASASGATWRRMRHALAHWAIRLMQPTMAPTATVLMMPRATDRRKDWSDTLQRMTPLVSSSPAWP